MERTKREASQRVANYRKFHLSGSLSEQVVGQVAQGILHFDSPEHKQHSNQNTPSSENNCATDRSTSHSHLASRSLSHSNVGASPLLNTHTPAIVTASSLSAGDIDYTNTTGYTTPARISQSKQSTKDAIDTIAADILVNKASRDTTSEQQLSKGTPQVEASTSLGFERIRLGSTDTAAAMAEDLKQELQRQKELTQSLQQQVAQAEVLKELEEEKQQQQAWQATLDKLKQAQEAQAILHADRLAAIEAMDTAPKQSGNTQLEWLQKKLAELRGSEPSPEELKKEEETRKAKEALEKILEEQKQLTIRAAEVAKNAGTISPEVQALLSAITPEQPKTAPDTGADGQLDMVEQLRAALMTKNSSPSGDWQKDVLRQFLTNTSKTSTPGGATTLKPDILKRITNESDEFSMADWLATLNKEEAGEWLCDESAECKHKKVKSGILDKATSNIVHKEVWPQKNLLEDWADEEIEFTQLQFEHHIAGEVRTIETCTDPAQILGRLRLLRRMAYAKLRGYDWPIVRKMYAAIVRSIEAKEYSWSDNFDRFETILYRRPHAMGRQQRTDRDQNTQPKKWFCRDWNKPEGCNKSAPHKAWFGSGTNATSRTVIHMCAACYMRDRTARDHPENSDACPHKTA